MITSRLLKNRKLRSGQAIVIIAVSMVVLLAIVALGIDGSKYYTQRRVAQNAADEAALAGYYYYANNPTANDETIFNEIKRVASADQVDTSNASNLTAYWYDNNGNPIAGSTFYSSCSGVVPASACMPPTNAQAIQVAANIPYATFLGGFVGKPNATASATGMAREYASSYKQVSGDTSQLNSWVGGSTCNAYNNVAMQVGQGHTLQGFSITGGLYVDGSASVMSHGANPEMNAGNTVIRVSTFDQSSTPGTADPFHFVYEAGSYVAPSNAPAKGFPQWAYLNKTLIDASSFIPDSSFVDPHNGTASPSTFGGNYFQLYKASYSSLGSAAPASFFHYIKEANGHANDVELQREIGLHMTGIFYVDGDLGGIGQYSDATNINTYGTDSSQATRGTPAGVTTIVAGKVYLEAAHFGTAGPAAMNISLLAGYNPGNAVHSGTSTYQKCANYVSDAVVTELPNTTNVSTVWDGIIYVPYGQVAFDNDVTSPIVAYSLSVGWTPRAGGTHGSSVSAVQCNSYNDVQITEGPGPNVTVKNISTQGCIYPDFGFASYKVTDDVLADQILIAYVQHQTFKPGDSFVLNSTNLCHTQNDAFSGPVHIFATDGPYGDLKYNYEHFYTNTYCGVAGSTYQTPAWTVVLVK